MRAMTDGQKVVALSFCQILMVGLTAYHPVQSEAVTVASVSQVCFGYAAIRRKMQPVSQTVIDTCVSVFPQSPTDPGISKRRTCFQTDRSQG